MTSLHDKLSEIERRVDAATKGPWNAYDWPGFPRTDEVDGFDGCVRIESNTTVTAFCFSGKPNDDALFIAASRSDVPLLLKLLRRAIAALEVNDCYINLEMLEQLAHGKEE